MNREEDNTKRHDDSFSKETVLQWILDVVMELRDRNPNVLDCVKTTIDLIERYARDGLKIPKRNCDKFTIGEALCKYGFPTKSKPWGEKEWLDFCEWYIGESN